MTPRPTPMVSPGRAAALRSNPRDVGRAGRSRRHLRRRPSSRAERVDRAIEVLPDQTGEAPGTRRHVLVVDLGSGAMVWRCVTRVVVHTHEQHRTVGVDDRGTRRDRQSVVTGAGERRTHVLGHQVRLNRSGDCEIQVGLAQAVRNRARLFTAVSGIDDHINGRDQLAVRDHDSACTRRHGPPRARPSADDRHRDSIRRDDQVCRSAPGLGELCRHRRPLTEGAASTRDGNQHGDRQRCDHETVRRSVAAPLRAGTVHHPLY